MQNTREIHNLLLELLSQLERTTLLWQFAVLAISLTLAWWLSSIVQNRIATDGSWHVGISSFHRVAFPVTATLLVLGGKAILIQWQPVPLLNIAVPLLLALALIRIALYLARKAFVSGDWIKPWERVFSIIIWIGLALHITGFLPVMLDWLDEIHFVFGKQHLSLLLLIQGALSVFVTVIISLWLGRLLENRIMRAEQMDINLRVLVTKFLRALLLLISLLIALPLVGIDITVLSIFGGALGVGLGLGLQKVASNYVSGFIILLDKSIHIGDVLTADNRFGTVSGFTARYLILKGRDGTESIIPNEILITSTVVNHSFTDRKVRINMPIQISYNSELETAMRIMLESAESHTRVITEPKPRVLLKDFGDNGITLEVEFWIADPEEGQLPLRSDINLQIWQEFKKQGVEFPYPRRDIRIINEPSGIPRSTG